MYTRLPHLYTEHGNAKENAGKAFHVLSTVARV